MANYHRNQNADIAIAPLIDKTNDEVQPIKIVVTLSHGASRTFRFGTKLVAFGIAMTIASAMWGSVAAWWVAWDKFSGVDKVRQRENARLIANEVSLKLEATGALAKSEKDLLTQIRDQFDRIWVTSNTLNHPIEILESQSISSKTAFAASIANERRIQSEIKTHPTNNFAPQSFSEHSAVRVESVSHFANSSRDIFRIDLSSIAPTSLQQGLVTSFLKYEVDGIEKIVDCCSSTPEKKGQISRSFNGIPFNFRVSVRKYIEVTRPVGAIVRLKEIKVGISSSFTSEFTYTDWLIAGGHSKILTTIEGNKKSNSSSLSLTTELNESNSRNGSDQNQKIEAKSGSTTNSEVSESDSNPALSEIFQETLKTINKFTSTKEDPLEGSVVTSKNELSSELDETNSLKFSPEQERYDQFKRTIETELSEIE